MTTLPLARALNIVEAHVYDQFQAELGLLVPFVAAGSQEAADRLGERADAMAEWEQALWSDGTTPARRADVDAERAKWRDLAEWGDVVTAAGPDA